MFFKYSEMQLSDTELQEIEKELKISFVSFFEFSIELLETLTKKNNNLKFAVVNMQISLELFLKYYFVKTGEPEKALNFEKGKIKYRDFSEVLLAYFSTVRWSYTNRKHLSVIGDTRNAIVHRGKHNEWNAELAQYFIVCALFIQGTFNKEFDETLFGIRDRSYNNKLSKNSFWIKGAVHFSKSISDMFGCQILHCPHCRAKALIHKNFFSFDDDGSNSFQCLACLQDINVDFEVNIVDCPVCKENSYMVEALNPQKDQIHLSLCLNCLIELIVKKCRNCDKYYFPDFTGDFKFEGLFFCSEDCGKFFGERQPLT